MDRIQVKVTRKLRRQEAKQVPSSEKLELLSAKESTKEEKATSEGEVKGFPQRLWWLRRLEVPVSAQV